MTIPPFGWKNAPNATTPLSAAELEAFGAYIAQYFESGGSPNVPVVGTDGKVGGPGGTGLTASVVTVSRVIQPSGDATGATDAAAISGAAVAGAKIVLAKGTFYITATALGVLSNFGIYGSGKGATVINVVGAGIGLQIGPNYPTAIGANSQIVLEDFTLVGTSSATGGLRISRLQDFRCRNVEVRGFSAASAFAWEFHACNCGLLWNCDGRQSTIGVSFVTDADSGSNLIEWVGGQITGNATGITTDTVNTAAQGNKFRAVNIAANTAAPAIKLRRAAAWELSGNWFEGNAAGTAVIQLGDSGTATYAVDCVIENNLVVETTALTYIVQVQQGINNTVVGNAWQGSSALTAFLRNEAGGSATAAGYNASDQGHSYSTGFVSDANGVMTTLATATAGASYTANEQTMLQNVYNVAKRLGLIA